MQIKLNDEEVRTALITALENKTQDMYGSFDSEDCFFTVKAAGKEVDDLEEVEFTVNL